MKVKELRSKSVEELTEMLKELYKEKFSLRMLKGMRNNPKPHLFRSARLGIAQIKTILVEKGRTI